MIELIFALVIMGIALMSAPMLIHQSIQSSNVALQQEAIASLSTHVGIILSKPWDEKDTNTTIGLPRIITLNTEASFSPFALAGISAMPDATRKWTYGGNPIMASALGRIGDKNESEFNDIDDYNNEDTQVTLFNGEDTTVAELGDYVDKEIKIHTDVTFANDRPDGTNLLNAPVIDIGNNIFDTPNLAGVESHIKFVNAVLTTDTAMVELNKTITLKAFSCNLGSYNLGRVVYQ